MVEALVVSQILLWLLIIGLGLMCFALARQIGILHERIAPAGALSINKRLKVRDPAPQFSAVTRDGMPASIGGARSRNQLLFFLSPDCPLCKTLLPVVKSFAAAERKSLDVLLVSDGEGEEHDAFRAREGLHHLPYVLSETLGRAYGVAKLPYAVLIDKEGRIAALGLVNSREHLESLVEAKERGVASLQDYLKRLHKSSDDQRISA
ncbi:MAG: redoxin family protein [Pseudomonadota bacterium]